MSGGPGKYGSCWSGVRDLCEAVGTKPGMNSPVLRPRKGFWSEPSLRAHLGLLPPNRGRGNKLSTDVLWATVQKAVLVISVNVPAGEVICSGEQK